MRKFTNLTAIVAAIGLLTLSPHSPSLLGVGTPSALAAAVCDGWEEGPGTDWYYLDANYGAWKVTAPLVIEIDGDATDGQTFDVGDTVLITSHLRAVTASCSGGHNESFSIATLGVSGPSGPDSDTTGNIFDFSDTECSETDHAETLSISYSLSSLGTHTISMNSNAQIDQYFGGLSVSNDCTAELSFEVVTPVDIDIKPGSDPNSINLCGAGVVPVAIFGSADFDVSTIDVSSLRLGDSSVKLVGKVGREKSLCRIEDVDNDGFDDMVCQFSTVELVETAATVSLEVLGTNAAGNFVGSDSVNIVRDTCN